MNHGLCQRVGMGGSRGSLSLSLSSCVKMHNAARMRLCLQLRNQNLSTAALAKRRIGSLTTNETGLSVERDGVRALMFSDRRLHTEDADFDSGQFRTELLPK